MNLLDLPREIRDHIYTLLLSPSANRHTTSDDQTTYTYTHASLLLSSRQIHHEALNILLEQNTFVKISTPFPESKLQVAEDGVPIILSEELAEEFTRHTLHVTIGFSGVERDEDSFVIHLDDLDKFCESWFYSAADYPELNAHLTLGLEVRDAFAASALLSGRSAEKMRKGLQQKLLFPFGRIKNLMEVEVTGTPFPDEDVVQEMKRLMAVPLGSPTERLIAAAGHKDAGNAALMADQPLEALEHYRKAWEAMFIIVKGKHRKLHGEGYFDTTLTEPPFEGQYGGMVRTVLRVRLVANSLLAYLKLKDWDTVIHIGMRTINIMRGGQESLEPEQEASNGWIAGSEMGKIYYRTAVAFKEMDDKYEARRLLKVAVLYLPNDARVREMIRECALRLG
jgi:tetratricopeptide (TPR) repeat protein